MKRIIFVFCMIGLSVQPARSQWSPASGLLEGGYVYSFATHGNYLFAGTSHGVFRSTDHGASWTACNPNLASKTIMGLSAIGAQLYANTLLGLYVSTDDGDSWKALMPETNAGPSKVLQQGKNLIFCNGFGVYVSTDNGSTWNAAMNAEIITDVATQAGVYYAAAEQLGLNFSSDDGATWKPLTALNAIVSNGSTKTTTITAIGNALVAGTSIGYYRSTDNGASWSLQNSGTRVTSVIANGNTAYAITDAGVMSSSDGGATWSTINASLSPNVLFLDGANLLAGTNGAGVTISHDHGSTFVRSNHGLNALGFGQLATDGTTLYASGVDMLRSSDNGATWSVINNGLNGRSVNRLLATPTALYAATNAGLYISTDKGDTWLTTHSDTLTYFGYAASRVSDVALLDGYIFIATNLGIYRSKGNSDTWQYLDSSQLSGYGFDALATMGQTVLAGMNYAPGGEVLLRSKVDGTHWDVTPAFPIYRFIPSFDRIFATTGILRVSSDTGTTWNSAQSFPYYDSVGYFGAFDSTYIISTISFGNSPKVFVSTNAGATWNDVTNGLGAGDFYTPMVPSAVMLNHRLIVSGPNGISSRPTGSAGVTTASRDFSLSAYPNPSHGSVQIKFTLAESAPVELTVVDQLGSVVRTMNLGKLGPGYHRVSMNEGGLANGIYFARFTSATSARVLPIILDR